MSSLEALCAALPEVANDIKLNLLSVLTGPLTLSEVQRWGVALSCAYASREQRVVSAVLAETSKLDDAHHIVDDAKAAAVLMAMNNTYYRFRHFIEKPSYETKPARLRMNRVNQPVTSKLDFELFALAVSAINGCATCVQHHEKVVVAGGLSEQQVNDAIRIAATIHAAAVAIEIGRDT
jgi:lipoyl-dependent peroxiredoxin subunit D